MNTLLIIAFLSIGTYNYSQQKQICSLDLEEADEPMHQVQLSNKKSLSFSKKALLQSNLFKIALESQTKEEEIEDKSIPLLNYITTIDPDTAHPHVICLKDLRFIMQTIADDPENAISHLNCCLSHETTERLLNWLQIAYYLDIPPLSEATSKIIVSTYAQQHINEKLLTQLPNAMQKEVMKLYVTSNPIFINFFQQKPQILQGHTNWVHSARYSPDGSHIVSASDDKTIRIWDATNGQLLQTLQGHANWVRSACYSPDESHIVSASDDKTIRIWDATNGQFLHTLQGHRDRVYSACYSPDGLYIASASNDKTIRIWNATNGQLLHTLQGHTICVFSVCYSPDGSHIVSASADNTIRIWDASSEQLLHTLQGHTSWVSSVCYSPDGLHIVSASGDRTIRIWNTTNGQLLHTLQGHTNWVRSVCYSPDGLHIVSASADNTIRIWNATNGQLIRTLQGNTNGVRSACYSPDGSHVVSASDDNTIRIWNTTIQPSMAILTIAQVRLLETIITKKTIDVSMAQQALFYSLPNRWQTLLSECFPETKSHKIKSMLFTLKKFFKSR